MEARNNSTFVELKEKLWPDLPPLFVTGSLNLFELRIKTSFYHQSSDLTPLCPSDCRHHSKLSVCTVDSCTLCCTCCEQLTVAVDTHLHSCPSDCRHHSKYTVHSWLMGSSLGCTLLASSRSSLASFLPSLLSLFTFFSPSFLLSILPFSLLPLSF